MLQISSRPRPTSSGSKDRPGPARIMSWQFIKDERSPVRELHMFTHRSVQLPSPARPTAIIMAFAMASVLMASTAGAAKRAEDQEVLVTGVVTDTAGQGVAGATVELRGKHRSNAQPTPCTIAISSRRSTRHIDVPPQSGTEAETHPNRPRGHPLFLHFEKHTLGQLALLR